MTGLLHVLYNLILSLWVGGIAAFIFFITPVIFRSFGRDMAGQIVGRLFPGYFFSCLGLAAAVLVLIVSLRSSMTHSAFKWSLALVLIALAISLFTTFRLHPEIKRVKQEIHSFEALPGDAPARKTFRKLHALSAMLNLLLLADGVALMVMSTSMKT